jgi:UDP-N-acetylglucosamine acyltransferase
VPHIHPTAIVDSLAELDETVEVGAYAMVGAGVRVGANTWIGPHAVLQGPARIGDDNQIFPFACVGLPPQQRDPQSDDGESILVIGRANVIREYVSIHRGTRGHPTLLGDHNLLMASSHVAHDVTMGSYCTLANGVQIAGHATIEDYANFGGLAAVAQRVRVGESAFVAGGAMCEREVPPFVIVQGDRARVRALNRVGLERRGFSPLQIQTLKKAFRAIFVQRKIPPTVAAKHVLATADHPFVKKLCAAVIPPPPSDDRF